jgi:DNA processing protein
VTVVIEAAVGSGALITAGAALDQGREVMAVPGNITSPVSVGTNQLIRDGATPVLEAADVLEHFPEVTGGKPAKPAVGSTTKPLPLSLSPEEQELANLFGPEQIHPDELATRSKRPVSEVLGLLCSLEIAGVVEQRPGRVFRRL